MKKRHVLILVTIAAILLLAVACNTSGLTPEQIAQAKKLAAMGVKMPDPDSMSAEEKEVYKQILNSSGDMSKEFVKFLGDNAKDEKKFDRVMKSLEKEPLKTLSVAARSPRRKPQEEEDPNKIYEVDIKSDEVPSKGPDDAPIVIYEFSEFQCPFCKRGANTMKEVMDEYEGKIKLYYVMRPLGFHQKAPAAAAASFAAWKQGKFWEFHDYLWEHQKEMGEELYLKWAEENGMNMSKFKEDMKVEKWQGDLDRFGKVADGLGVRGVPTFFVNGKKLRGAKPKAAFKEVIDGILAEKK